MSGKAHNIAIRYDYNSSELQDDYYYKEYDVPLNDSNKRIGIGDVNKAPNNKASYIFVHYYDENDDKDDFFENDFIQFEDDVQFRAEIKAKWIVINDCNISSSTKIFGNFYDLDNDPSFNNLIGLDLSFNSICDLEAIAHIIRNSPQLRYLDLSHNPIEFQSDLFEKVLSENPGISVINRKRVTPSDFYQLFKSKPKYRNDEKYKINQIDAAVRTIQKDRIYPPTAERKVDNADLKINGYNLGPNFIDTINVTAIDLSNCDLVYFDFNLFPNAFFIDLSNNHIKTFVFKNAEDKKLLYLDISGNEYGDLSKFAAHFPLCNINPSKLGNYKYSHFPKDANNDDTLQNDYVRFSDLKEDMNFFLINKQNRNFSKDVNQESNLVKIECSTKCKNRVKFVYKNNDKNNDNNNDNNNNLYICSSHEIARTLIDDIHHKQPIDQNGIEINCTYKENFEHLSNGFEGYLLYFIAYLNIGDFEIKPIEFNEIFTKCRNICELIIKFTKKGKKEDTVDQTYFRDFQKNIMKSLVYFEIKFNEYEFEDEKLYNRFIKKICHLPHLKYFNISGYTNALSERDEIDTTFKFLRGLDTFNGYRNLIPPTPAQYLALTKFHDAIKKKQEGNMKTYFNLNNLQFLILYENDLNNDPDNDIIHWSKVLPIRHIKVGRMVNKEVEYIDDTQETQELVKDKSKVFDKYPRLRYVNDKRTTKGLTSKDSEKENEQFDSFTSNAERILKGISRIQFFLVYSAKASSSFTSKLLYLLFTILNKIERFMIIKKIRLTDDFISNYEKIVLSSLFPLLTLKLLIWDPSYKWFSDVSKSLCKFCLIITLMTSTVLAFLIFFAIIDSRYFEKSAIPIPYAFQFLIYIIALGFLINYYRVNIYVRTTKRSGIRETSQEQNIFNAFLEFKFIKNKISYSLLIIMVMPICSIVLGSDPSFTFVYIYRLVYTLIIILSLAYVLISGTINQWKKIVGYLDLKDADKRYVEKDNDNLDSHQTSDEKTYYFVADKSEDQEGKGKKFNCNFVSEGALKYKITTADKKYNKFAIEYRSPTQIFYGSYRFRPLQNLCGFIDILQRIATEVVSKFCERYLFIVSSIMLIYVSVWWPYYDVGENIGAVLSSLGNVLMTLSNFLLYFFSMEDNEKMKIIVSYVDILGMMMSLVALVFPTAYNFLNKYIEKRRTEPTYNDISLSSIEQFSN